MADNSQELSQDAIFDLLSNSRRRFVLQRLQSSSTGIELGELATELAAKENGVPPEELSAQQRKRTYVSLYQTHVPKLVESGVVTYDSDSGIIRHTERVKDLAAYFECDSDSIPWETVYLLFAVVGLGVFLVSYRIQTPPVVPSYVGIGVLFVFILLSVIHYIYAEKRGRNGAKILIEGE